jgi:NADPH-dependent curcumin reductase CurA
MLRTLWISCAPAMREWMDDNPLASAPPVGIGEPMRSPAVAEVVESRSPAYQPGDLVMGQFGWQECAVLKADACWGDDAREWRGVPRIQRVPAGVAPSQALGVLGGNGLAAYFGMLHVARAAAGETVLVSGAAGATGSIAGQLARLRGCRVVGIAGGDQKCAMLRDTFGFDAAVDYRQSGWTRSLAHALPEGFDAMFDNVQGAVLDACLPHMRKGARIALCGAMATLSSGVDQPVHGLMHMVWKRATMTGFSVFEFRPQFPRAIAELGEWVRSGRIQFTEDIKHGFEAIPQAFIGMLAGRNLGKQLVKLADPTSTQETRK